MKRILISTLLFFLISGIDSNSQVLYQPNNLNFEKGAPGIKPPFWNFPKKLEDAGYTAKLISENPAEGDLCAEISSPESDKSNDPENIAVPIYQAIDAMLFKGKKVRLSASARIDTKNMTSTGEIWVIGRSTKENVTISKYLDENPVVKAEWNKFEIVFDVPEETNEIRFGILLKGNGKLLVDDFKLEIIPPTGSSDEPAKKLDRKSINNLVAFSRLYGYLHFFNSANTLSPSQNELMAFWGIANSEKAKDEKELMSFLEKYTKMISPNAVITNIPETKDSYPKPEESPDYLALTNQHIGGPVERSDDLFSSRTTNVFASTRKREASASQVIEVLKYKGKKIKVSASIKVEQDSPGANAQIWVRVDRIAKNEPTVETTVEKPAMVNAWKKYEILMDLPEDVYTIKLALVFIGEGKASFDDIKVEVVENNKKIADIDVLNSGFEIIGDNNFPKNWEFEQAVVNAGYKLFSDSTSNTKGRYSVSFQSDKANRINYPIIGKLYSYKIDKNVYLHHPLVYYGDTLGTVAAKIKPDFSIPGKPFGYQSSVNDRFARIGSVIKLWNLIRHFSINEISDKNLDSALVFAIEKVSESEKEFDSVLESLLKITDDLRTRKWNLNLDYDYSLPFIFRDYGGKYLINTVVDSTLGIEIGDEVVNVGNEPIELYIQKRVASLPGSNNKYKIIKCLAELRSGSKGTTEAFKIRKKNGELIDVKASRDLLLQNVYEPKPMYIAELDSGYVYINLSELSDDKLKDFIPALALRHSYIFDLRGMTGISEHFLGLLTDKEIKNAKWEIPVYTQPDKTMISTLTFGGESIAPKEKLLGKKCVFLIDERTSGYAEAIASIVKNSKLGTVMGLPTAGNASEVFPVRLFGGYSVSLSGLNVYSPDGVRLINNSVSPDIRIEYSLPTDGKLYDSLIENAYMFLKK